MKRTNRKLTADLMESQNVNSAIKHDEQKLSRKIYLYFYNIPRFSLVTKLVVCHCEKVLFLAQSYFECLSYLACKYLDSEFLVVSIQTRH